MVGLLDNTGVQHYANKMVLAENRKVGSKSLPAALNDIDNLIDEMKTQFDAEYGSALDMKLENNKNVFSVGTGTNVDKKSEIKNSFTDVELSGNSLVNLVSTKGDNLFGLSGSGVAFNTTFNTDLTRCVYTTKEETNKYITIRTGSKERIKSNTTYTLIFNIFKNNILELQRGISIRGVSDPYYTQKVSDSYFNIYTDSSFDITSGIKVIRFTTGDNTNEYTGFGFGFPCVTTSVAEQQFEIGDIVLLEGDYVNKPILQYFKGLKSIGEKEDGNHKISISSVGKNLCPITEYKIYNVPINQNMNGYRDTIIARNIRVKPNTMYAIYVKDIIGAPSNTALKVMTFRDRIAETGLTHVDCYTNPNRIREYSINRNRFNATITTESDANYINVTTGGLLAESSTITYVDLQIVEGSTVNSIDSYKEDKKEISLNEPLRRVSNTAKDTIEKINGEWKIVRRCGEIILDDSLPYNNHSNDNVNFDEYKIFDFCANTVSQANSISDNFLQTANDRIVCHAKIVYIRFNKAREINTLEKCKQWFKSNPTKVVYQLETPIIEDISPITLQCWKNGTISIDEDLPVETTHTVALNKPAQIKRNIEELTALRKRVQTLEEQYDQIALEQAHQLNLINHSIELDYNI